MKYKFNAYIPAPTGNGRRMRSGVQRGRAVPGILHAGQRFQGPILRQGHQRRSIPHRLSIDSVE